MTAQSWRKRLNTETGQVLVVVLILLAVLSTLVPLMVMYSQNEAKWTAKESRNTEAFHLAEAGIEKSLLILTQSTITWVNLMNGQWINNFHFDTAFTDVPGGTYAVYIASGPQPQQATVISVGRDNQKKEVRALKAIYANSPLGNTALYAGAGAQIGGGVKVEWGGVISPTNIVAGSGSCGGGPCHPQFWSAGNISPWSTTPPGSCDSPNCVQWHSYDTGIPPAPIIDLDAYKSSAQATSTYYGCGGGCTFVQSSSDTKGYSNYYDGNLTVVPSNKLDITGSLIVMGNLNLPNGVWGNGSANLIMPQDAWKQYGRDWSFYTTNFGSCDPTAGAGFPGLNSQHLSTKNCSPITSSKLAVNGLLYVQGALIESGGAGNADIYGAMYVIGTSTTTSASGTSFYYNHDVSQGIQVTQVLLTRIWWQDVVYPWPGLP